MVNLCNGGRKTKNGKATSESQPDNDGRDVLHSATPRVWWLLPLSLGDDRVLSFIRPKPLRSQQAQNLLQSENKNSNKCSIVELLFSLRIIAGTTNIHFYTCASRLRVIFEEVFILPFLQLLATKKHPNSWKWKALSIRNPQIVHLHP